MKLKTPLKNRVSARMVGRFIRFIEYKGYNAIALSSAELSAKRAKRIFKDKIDSTFPDLYKAYPGLYRVGYRTRFLTFTFRGDFPSHRHVSECFKLFQKRIKRQLGDEYSNIRYIAIKERGSMNKRLHIHALFFSPYWDRRTWENFWDFGNIWFEYIPELDKADCDIPQLSGYLAKYFEKNFDREYDKESECEKIDFSLEDKGKKRFFSSRNVKRRVTYVANTGLSSLSEVEVYMSGYEPMYRKDNKELSLLAYKAPREDKGKTLSMIRALRLPCTEKPVMGFDRNMERIREYRQKQKSMNHDIEWIKEAMIEASELTREELDAL